MSIFTKEFLENLNSDSKIALYQICKLYCESTAPTLSKLAHSPFEFFAVVEAFIDSHNLKYDLPDISTGKRVDKITRMRNFGGFVVSELSDYVNEDKELVELNNFRKQYSTTFGNSFCYEFSDRDIKRIQVLITELREIISSSTDFEEKHKRRLLKRLEKLQSELHKKMADLDLFWGLVGDAGVAIGKFGKNAKPFVDRLKEITQITWRTQSKAEELPDDSNHPLLEHEGNT